MTELPDGKRRIVSSRHLAEGEGWEASEIEYGMIIAYNAFSRWMTRCMSAAGNTDLTPLEILVLHNANHRGRDKRLTDICFLLNIEDTHTVNYALRKLLKMELLKSEKRGKEVFYSTSATGAALCDDYREVRSRCFLDGLSKLDMTGERCAKSRRLCGLYRGSMIKRAGLPPRFNAPPCSTELSQRAGLFFRIHNVDKLSTL